jgi:phospholipid/cholesterol/gamma-HCH transport system ATP-binding protein
MGTAIDVRTAVSCFQSLASCITCVRVTTSAVLGSREASVQDKATDSEAHIEVRDLTMAYGDFVIQRDLNFTVKRGDIFVIMGGSGCGKSTLMRHLVGLKPPAHGQVLYEGVNFWDAETDERARIMRRFGILYQAGALWSSMTLAENVGLPLGEYTDLSSAEIREIVALKLALVGLAGFEEFYPAEISGGMRKRAGLARAMALDPDILFFDEPSAGLDPVSSRRLDDLILELRESLGATVVVVTHELPSIFAIGNNSVFLDAATKTMIASGDPHTLLAESQDPTVRSFLTRGTEEPPVK